MFKVVRALEKVRNKVEGGRCVRGSDGKFGFSEMERVEFRKIVNRLS